MGCLLPLHIDEQLLETGDRVGDVLLHRVQVADLGDALAARGVPLLHLQADEHAGNHDHEVDRDRRPVLRLHVLDDAAEEHVPS